MRFAIGIGLLLVAGAAAIALTPSTEPALARQSAPEQQIAWETDLAVARQKAKETGRPLMVVFR